MGSTRCFESLTGDLLKWQLSTPTPKVTPTLIISNFSPANKPNPNPNPNQIKHSHNSFLLTTAIQLQQNSNRQVLTGIHAFARLTIHQVFRSAYRPKHKYQPPAPGEDGSAKDAPSAPKLRTAHPRPYLPSFRKYLFAPETQAWLDVMVWSSAQPHSVQGMVDRVFGSGVYENTVGKSVLPSASAPAVDRNSHHGAATKQAVISAEQEVEVKETGTSGGVETTTVKPRLLAVWARDTLGLSETHYCTYNSCTRVFVTYLRLHTAMPSCSTVRRVTYRSKSADRERLDDPLVETTHSVCWLLCSANNSSCGCR